MSGPTNPGSPPPEVPPEVPPEFADAYRAAYERALAEQGLGPPYVAPELVGPEQVEPEVSTEGSEQNFPAAGDAPPPGSRLDPEPEPAEDPEAALSASEPRRVAGEQPEQASDQPKSATTRGVTPSGSGAKPATQAAGRSSTWFDGVRRSKWFVPILLALLAIVLILGAYLVGRRLADQVETGSAPKAASRVINSGEPSDQEAAKSDEASPAAKAKAKAKDGKVEPVGDVRARTGCTSEAGVDASGQQ